MSDFGRNLTALALQGSLPPLIGRAAEIDQLIGILLMKEAIAGKARETLTEYLSLKPFAEILRRQSQAIERQNPDDLNALVDSWARFQDQADSRCVTRLDIARVVSKRSGAVIDDAAGDIRSRVSTLEKAFQESFVGQEKAVQAILTSFKRVATGFRKSNNRPLASFLFLGPSGTGKTESARVIARSFFGTEGRMIRFNMSEFYDHHTVSKFLGSPRGYIGSEEDGMLITAVRKQPFSVILFDEFEKADPKIHDIFLQILDEGEIEDMKGNRASFRDTVIVVTSNIGSRELFAEPREEFSKQYDTILTRLRELLCREVRPEIINRFDHIEIFAPLTHGDLQKIFHVNFALAAERFQAQTGAQLAVTQAAVELAVRRGFDPRFGARPVRREIETMEAIVAETLFENPILPGSRVVVDVADGQYVVCREVIRV